MSMATRWLFFTAFRWGFSRKGGKSASRAILAGMGIAAGVVALIVVLGVMGGLQKGYIDSVLEISSFHLRIQVPGTVSGDGIAETLEKVRALKGVRSASAFREIHVIAVGSDGRTLPLTLRAMSPGQETHDPGLVTALGLPANAAFPLPGSIVPGRQAALLLGAGQGDTISLLGVRQDADEGILPIEAEITIGETFSSGYYEYDSSLAFVALDSAPELQALFASTTLTIGIKLDNRFRDMAAIGTVASALPEGSSPVVSWREYNRSFFGALKTEKTVMMALISLIFMVVGLNISHSMRRTIAAKMSDIGMLKALGASDRSVRSIFLLEGTAIGLSGAVAGVAIGLALLGNLNPVLNAAAAVVRFFASIATPSASGGTNDFRLFSPAYFYIEKVPVSIRPGEIAFIAFLAIFSTIAAAYSASGNVSRARPQEVLRDE